MNADWSNPAGVWKQVSETDWLPAGAKFLKPWRRPIVDQRVVRLVAGEALLHAFRGDHAEDVLQAEDQRNRRRGGRVVFFRVFGELDEIKIIAAVRHAFGAFERGLRSRRKRQSRRQRERLLDAGQQHVDAEFVHLDRHGGERRNRIHHEQHAGKDFTTLAMPARSFITPVEVSLWIRVTRSKPPSSSFAWTASGEIASPHSTCTLSACEAHAFGHAEPLVGKRAAAEVEDFFRAEVLERRLHHAPGG
jgi:hypothetical protein